MTPPPPVTDGGTTVTPPPDAGSDAGPTTPPDAGGGGTPDAGNPPDAGPPPMTPGSLGAGPWPTGNVTYGAADDVGGETQGCDVVLNGLHAPIVTVGSSAR